MRCWTPVRVEDRRHALHTVERWPTHLLAVVDDHAAAALPRWQRVDWQVEVCSDVTDDAHPRAPSLAQVARIVDLGRALRPGDRLLVHCASGVSRSTAAALVVWCAQGRDPAAALRSLLRQRSQADPNPLILRHADALLHAGEPRLLAVWYGWRNSEGRTVPGTDEALAALPHAWSVTHPEAWWQQVRALAAVR